MKGLSAGMLLWLLGASSGAQAGGVMLYEAGQEDVGLANAGSAARATDPSVLMSNPAGIARLKGTQVNWAGQLVFGNIRFDRAAGSEPGNDGGNGLEYLPGSSFFISHQLDERSSVGFGVYGNFGLALDYDDDWTGRYFVQDTALIGVSFQPTYAFKVRDDIAIGIGPRLVYGLFRSDVAINNNPLALRSTPDGQMEYRSHDWGSGVNLGLHYQPSPEVRLGLAYTSKVDLEFEDSPALDGVDNPLLDLALRRLGLDQLKVDMEIPQTVTASATWQVLPDWMLLASAGWQDWSEFGAVGIEVDAANPRAFTADRQYQDTWHLSFGAQHQLDARLRWNVGIGYDSSAVKDRDRTLDNPMNETWRFATGVNYQLEEGMDLNFSYALLWLGDMDVDQQKRSGDVRVSGEYRNAALHIISGGVVWRF